MTAFQAEDFLLVREQGRRQDAVDRAVSLLGRVHPDADGEALLRLPLGRRNAELLDLREELFGRGVDAFAECPHCGEALEFALDVDALRAAAGDASELAVDGVRFRLLDSSDVKAAASCASVEEARAVLLQRCLLNANIADLPDTIVAEIARRMEEADPQAETLIDLVCPACERGWQLAFDIASFLYAEVDAQARRILREVHALARGYGWSERDILSMSPRRRREYLELLEQ